MTHWISFRHRNTLTGRHGNPRSGWPEPGRPAQARNQGSFKFETLRSKQQLATWRERERERETETERERDERESNRKAECHISIFHVGGCIHRSFERGCQSAQSSSSALARQSSTSHKSSSSPGKSGILATFSSHKA